MIEYFKKNRIHLYSKLLSLFVVFFSLVDCSSNSEDDSDTAILGLIVFNGSLLPTSTQNQNCPPSTLPIGVHIADTVVSAPGASNRPFGDPGLAINGICGSGETSGSFDVYELLDEGSGAELILRWKGKKVQNVPNKVDFIVFENSFRAQGSTQDTYFLEPVVVEVSLDGSNYCGFSPKFLPRESDPNHSATGKRDDWKNFAGLTPVLYNMTSNPIPPSELFNDPIRQASGGSTYYMNRSGGDGFDLDSSDFGNENVPGGGTCSVELRDRIRSEGFIYLKLVASYSRGFPNPLSTFRAAADIDGVIARSLVDE